MSKWIGNIFGYSIPSTVASSGIGTTSVSGMYDSSSYYYIKSQGGLVSTLSGLTATGGVISDYADGPTVYRAHIFTSSGTFDVSAIGDYPADVDVLVVGGGAGAGPGPIQNFVANGGGGGGGLVYKPGHSVSIAPYTITVGGGGAPSAYTGGFSAFGDDGVSPFPATSLIAIGGGIGMRGPGLPSGNEGGSGGGGDDGVVGTPGVQASSPNPRGIPADSITYGFGNDGGQGQSSAPAYAGGGGGGAGAVGGAAAAQTPGTGGDGRQYLIAGPPAAAQPIGTPGPNPGGGYFAGGGGGGYRYAASGGVGPGGAGGGGAGNGNATPATPGTYSTGGGGGGSGNGGVGGSGGSGIVVVRYQIGQLTAAKATGGAISYYGSKTIHTFTSSGTFVNTSGSPLSAEYVVVAGGGGGKAGSGGGGGAGGYITGPVTVPTSPITVQVGAGGNWRSNDGGTPSYFGTPITAYGGGSGVQPSMPGPSYANGGSGGGGWAGPGPNPYNTAGLGSRQTSTTSPTPISPQGNPGGTANGGPDFNSAAGGGGGAGGAGGNAGPNVAGNGGVGVQVPTTFRNPESAPTDTTNPQPSQRGGGLGTPGPAGEFYLAGGGGGGYDGRGGGPTGGSGGSGGGGGASVTGTPGLVNTGGGGGGSHAGYTSPTDAGNGGSGIVLIAYPS